MCDTNTFNRMLQITTWDVSDSDLSARESESELSEEQECEDTRVKIENFLDFSIDLPLKFQEASLRKYFREVDVDETGLRSSPSTANLIIFEMAVRILNTPDFHDGEDKDRKAFSSMLQEYSANCWLQHFLDIEPSATSDDDTALVINRLQLVMDPLGRVLKNIEEHLTGGFRVLGSNADHTEDFCNSLKTWAERAAILPQGLLDNDVLSWLQRLSLSSKHIKLQLARGHVLNWFSSEDASVAGKSFWFAFNILDEKGVERLHQRHLLLQQVSVRHSGIWSVSD
jgi:hypothetical protein